MTGLDTISATASNQHFRIIPNSPSLRLKVPLRSFVMTGTGHWRTIRGHADKVDFANYAPGFANRFMRLPGGMSLFAASLLAMMVAIVSGPFGTSNLPTADRAIFWTVSIALVSLLWRIWFAASIRSPDDWPKATLIGIALICLPMPVIIAASLALVGQTVGDGWWLIWPQALAIGTAIGLLIFYLARQRQTNAETTIKGRLWRHGITDPAKLARVDSEDHYLRLHLSDGRNLLVHDTFSAIGPELALLDGAVVRRGRWVAASDVVSITRDNRRLLVVTKNGTSIQVSSAGRTELRKRGWI